jgi:hypothetical protein
MLGIFAKYRMYIFALVGLLGVLIAYQMLSGGGESSSTVTNTTPTTPTQPGTLTPENAAIEQELLSQLLQLSTITLDDRVFSNPAFVSLVDFSQPIEPQPVGRPNPFAPIAVTVPPPAQVEPAATSTEVETLEDTLE